MQNPGPAHWDGVKRVIKYLGDTKDLWLTFGGRKATMLDGYCGFQKCNGTPGVKFFISLGFPEPTTHVIQAHSSI
jgi:hypothetical protein